MRLSHFFIDRPIFAAAVSVVITLTGLIAWLTLPVDQYPQIAPPTVSVSAVYPGATAEEIAESVAAPLEQQINGIQSMLYMSSSSTGEGRMSITVTFKPGTSVDIAQVEVQNRIQTVLPQLPQEVRDLGITVRKGSNDTLLIVHMFTSDGSVDRKYIDEQAVHEIREIERRREVYLRGRTPVPVAGATVIVDGKIAGQAPLVLTLKKNRSHRVRIEKEGFNPTDLVIKRKLTARTFITLLYIPIGAMGGLVGSFIVLLATNADVSWETPPKAMYVATIIGGALGAAGLVADMTTGANHSLSPKVLDVTLTKADGTPRVDTMLVDTDGIRNVIWIRVRRD